MRSPPRVVQQKKYYNQKDHSLFLFLFLSYDSVCFETRQESCSRHVLTVVHGRCIDAGSVGVSLMEFMSIHSTKVGGVDSHLDFMLEPGASRGLLLLVRVLILG